MNKYNVGEYIKLSIDLYLYNLVGLIIFKDDGYITFKFSDGSIYSAHFGCEHIMCYATMKEISEYTIESRVGKLKKLSSLC